MRYVEVPSPDDLAFVMSKADVIGDGIIHKPELLQAISIWYSIDDEEKVRHHHHHHHHHHSHHHHSHDHEIDKEKQFHKDSMKFSKESMRTMKTFHSDWEGGAVRPPCFIFLSPKMCIPASTVSKWLFAQD